MSEKKYSDTRRLYCGEFFLLRDVKKSREVLEDGKVGDKKSRRKRA